MSRSTYSVRSTAPTPVATGARRRRRTGRVLMNVLGIVAALVWFFPVYWMILSAFTPNAWLRTTTPTFLPVHTTLSNFAGVLDGTSFPSSLRMSLLITLTTVVLVLVFAFLAALAVSRFKFRGRTSFVLAVLFIQMLPAEGLFIAQYRMMSTLGQLNSIVGISVLYTAAVIPFTVTGVPSGCFNEKSWKPPFGASSVTVAGTGSS